MLDVVDDATDASLGREQSSGRNRWRLCRYVHVCTVSAHHSPDLDLTETPGSITPSKLGTDTLACNETNGHARQELFTSHGATNQKPVLP